MNCQRFSHHKERAKFNYIVNKRKDKNLSYDWERGVIHSCCESTDLVNFLVLDDPMDMCLFTNLVYTGNILPI